MSHTHSEWTTGTREYMGLWLRQMVSVWQNSVPGQVEGRQSGHTAENIEKSQHTDFNEDNESTNVACSHVQLWKLDTQKEWRKTSWGLWDERTEKDSACFVDSRPVLLASHMQHVSDLHLKFALRPHHVWKYGRHPACDSWNKARNKKDRR